LPEKVAPISSISFLPPRSSLLKDQPLVKVLVVSIFGKLRHERDVFFDVSKNDIADTFMAMRKLNVKDLD
jgi:hypothetical protein